MACFSLADDAERGVVAAGAQPSSVTRLTKAIFRIVPLLRPSEHFDLREGFCWCPDFWPTLGVLSHTRFMSSRGAARLAEVGDDAILDPDTSAAILRWMETGGVPEGVSAKDWEDW